MKCPKCQVENREGAMFCMACGSKLEQSCPACGKFTQLEATFCDSCGSSLTEQTPSSKIQPQAPSPQTPRAYTPSHLAERILAEQATMEDRGAADGERKTITALFADIKGSMELIEHLDPEEARKIIDPAIKLMMDAVHHYEGYVAQTLGDGIFALFGAPIAHEDHPQRALYAALRMQEESKRYAEMLRLEKGLNLHIRVGVNTGEVVVRSIGKDDLHTDYVPVGHSTSLAARMENLAAQGTIVVSDHTYRLTEGYFQFRELGAAKVQGVSEPVHIYEVVGVGPLRTRFQVAARRGLVRFVGRHSEMEQMKRAFEMAKEGHGQVVGVVGEPGVGKSRLFYEFKLISQRGCLVMETFSVSHGKAYPYLPLIELLKNYFHITPQNDERKRREKVTGKVLTLDRSIEDTLPYLLSLLGISDPASSFQQMDPQIKQRRTFEAIKRLLLRESLNQPILSIFEDLHWLDGETQALLDVLSESMATARILLLVNYRPEYRHGWGSKTYYTQLRLDPLKQKDAQELLTALLGNGTALHLLKQVIRAKTEGNPFFMEEVVQTLAEEKVLVGERGNYCFEKAPKELHIPTTVQGVLASRIDRLGVEEKALFQTLAVIGKKFSLNLIKKVMNKPEEELYPLLSHLQGAEFIYEQPAFPEVEYTFKHALTQEVAYNSVLIERRGILHELTAQAIVELYRDELDKHFSDLAHHYSRSGNTKKAVEYLHLAGQQAVQGSANAEAVNHLTTALELLKTLPDTSERAQQELTLQITLGAPLMVTKGYAAPEAQKTYARARELCKDIGETPQLYPVLFGLWSVYVVRAEYKTAHELGEQFLALAQSIQDPAFLLLAHYILGMTLLFLGELGTAREHLEQGIALYDPQQHRSLAFLYGEDPRVGCLWFSALILWYLGYPDQALKKIHDAITLAQEMSHSFTLVLALVGATWVYQCRREAQAAQEWAEAAITLSTEQGFAFYLAWGTNQRGWALGEQGKVEEGIAQMGQGLTAYRATGAELLRPYFLTLLAEMYGKGGQTEEGLTVLAEALAVLNKTEERISEPELYRIKGDLLLDLSEENQTEVEASFCRAIDISRRLSAKSLELRAVMSLSRLWQKQGKQEEARSMLAEIYGWFTEGFDTADLKEAKELLQEVS